MRINVQLKNFAKLLLIGAVLFVVSSLVSGQVVKCASAKNNNICQGDAVNGMFAQADRQAKPESPGYILVDSACVKAAVPPVAVTPRVLGAIVGDAAGYESGDESQKAIVEYEVEPDDTLSSLAEKFDISADTIRWANDLAKGAAIKPGQKLIISPITGTVHYVVSGDTMAQISQKYQAKSEDIIAFNELSGENDIFVGDALVVPGGKIVSAPVAQKPAASGSVSQSAVALPDNYFLCPVGSPCRRTQGAHFRNAVDLSGGYCGAPIYAAASGTVTKARGGWNGGAGNNVAISHLGGALVTHYYHLQTILVSPGQEVKKGDVIGLMGRTGVATGCHLHFEVIGGKNPF